MSPPSHCGATCDSSPDTPRRPQSLPAALGNQTPKLFPVSPSGTADCHPNFPLLGCSFSHTNPCQCPDTLPALLFSTWGGLEWPLQRPKKGQDQALGHSGGTAALLSCFPQGTEEAHPEMISCCIPIPWLSLGRGELLSPILHVTAEHTRSLFPRPPRHLRAPGSSTSQENPWGLGLAGCGDIQQHPARPSALPTLTGSLEVPSVGCYRAFVFWMQWGSRNKVWERRIPMSSPWPYRHRGSSHPGQMAAASCSSLENAQIHGQGVRCSCPCFDSSQQSEAVSGGFSMSSLPQPTHRKAEELRRPSRWE